MGCAGSPGFTAGFAALDKEPWIGAKAPADTKGTATGLSIALIRVFGGLQVYVLGRRDADILPGNGGSDDVYVAVGGFAVKGLRATAGGGKIDIFIGGQGTTSGEGFRRHRLGFKFAAADADVEGNIFFQIALF